MNTAPGTRAGLRRVVLAPLVIASVAALVACSSGSAPPPAAPTGSPGAAAPPSTGAAATAEVSPSGDIPDSQAYVPFTTTDGAVTVSVPEGWPRADQGTTTVFSDKLNSIRIETTAALQAPTPDSARTQELPGIAANTPGFGGGATSTVNRAAGPAVLVTYRATSAPSPVTGKSLVQDVERYEFWRAGRQVTLTLSAPVGADNVDPWRTVTNSLRWAS